MFRPFFLASMALAALLSAGCDDAGRTTTTEPQLETIRGGEQRLITMTDACDPQTFDAVLGVGACTRPRVGAASGTGRCLALRPDGGQGQSRAGAARREPRR